MCWLGDFLGVKFSTSNALVRRSAAVLAPHSEVPAIPLRVRMWFLFEELSGAPNGYVSALALFWLTLVQAVLRPAHAQRSQVLSVSELGFEGRASAGKTRYQGRRRPFWWRGARYGVSGVAWEVVC